jgi:hypothetical protein
MKKNEKTFPSILLFSFLHPKTKALAYVTLLRSKDLNKKKPQQIYKNNMKNLFYYIKTLEVGQHHTMDPIMEGILSCSLASSRGLPPIELPLKYNTSLHIHYIV